MCTVSIIPVRGPDGSASGLRAVCNRDESHARPAASAPRWRAASRGRALWPMDMEAGGTWIAAGEGGLVLSLLNINPDPPAVVKPPPDVLSRGLLIPELIGEADAQGAMARLADMALERYCPFRLVAAELTAEGVCIAEARWDGDHFGIAWFAEGPAAFTSSGLGDSRALPRLDLFETLVVRRGAMPAAQDAYHRHVWPERPEISILMHREDARTVSITTLDVPRGAAPMMLYEPIPFGRALGREAVPAAQG